MSRAQWKGLFSDNFLLKSKKFPKVVWSRRSTITAKFIGKRVRIHNGVKFIKVFITREHVGYKFGQFVFTKKYTQKYKTKVSKKKSKV